MTKKVLAIITARGGSKGLPGKNIIDFFCFYVKFYIF